MSSFTHALHRLKSAQKPPSGVSLYTRFINRPLGRVLASGAFVLRMTPNQVTGVSALATGAGLLLLAGGRPTLPRAGVVMLLLVLGFALDSADGQLARLTGGGSPAGEWLDHVVDSGKIIAVHGAVLITVYRFVPIPAWWYMVPIAFQMTGIVTFVGGLLVELLGRISRAGDEVTGRPARAPGIARAVALLPADYGVLALSFVLWGWPPLFLGTYTVLLVANLLIMALLLGKWFRLLKVDPVTTPPGHRLRRGSGGK